MVVVGEEDLVAVEVLGEEAVTPALAVVSMGAVSALAVSAAVGFVVVVSAELRTSQAGPRASEAEACHPQAGLRTSEEEACHWQAELACHRSDRTSLRDPAG
jgi:hypothetical protein